jgi:hypothetical protein
MPEDVEMQIEDESEPGRAKGLEDERCETMDMF